MSARTVMSQVKLAACTAFLVESRMASEPSIHKQKAQKPGVQALVWLYQYVWLRAVELSALQFPNDPEGLPKIRKILTKMKGAALVKTRQLPEGMGQAYVLDEAGLALLKELGYHQTESKKGLCWGTTPKGRWMPPKTWAHDLLRTGVLAVLRQQGCSVLSKATMKRVAPLPEVIPDGVYKTPNGHWALLEVEQDRISTAGDYRAAMHRLIAANSASGKTVAGIHCTQGVLVYDARSVHVDRLIASLSRWVGAPMEISVVKGIIQTKGLPLFESSQHVVSPR